MSEEKALTAARVYAEERGLAVESAALGGTTTMTPDGGRKYLVIVRCVEGHPLFVAVVIGPDRQSQAGPFTYHRT